jgi:imidazolonepropionase-like amidohydrolase
VKQAMRHGCDIINHVSFTDEEALDMLEAAKDRIFVMPTFSVIVRLLHEGAEFGWPHARGVAAGYPEELEALEKSMRALHKRGVRVLPGGDYGFAWAKHGENAKDLGYMVKYVGMTPMEALVAATKHGGAAMMMGNELGQLKEGFLADILLVDGDPLADLTVLLDKNKLLAIMKDGVFHKEPAQRDSRQQRSRTAAE